MTFDDLNQPFNTLCSAFRIEPCAISSELALDAMEAFAVKLLSGVVNSDFYFVYENEADVRRDVLTISSFICAIQEHRDGGRRELDDWRSL